MKTVLIVDDERPIAEMLGRMLEDEGYRVLTARDGREGLACLARERPDVVLCDLMMPGLDGRALCRAMHAHPAYRDIPVVLMSAASQATAADDCPHAAFVGKPFSIDDVLQTIMEVADVEKAR